MKKVFRTKRRHCHNLLKKSNVVAVGVGYREREGQQTGETAMLVFVSKKVASTDLQKNEIVPRSLEGAAVDVVEIGNIQLLGDDEQEPAGLSARTRHRPAPGGVSIGHYKISAGTLGAVVRDVKGGGKLALSNNHVLANSSSGNDGRASPGDAVLQPGRYDGGEPPGDIIGKLERFVPMRRTFQKTS